MKTKLRVVLVDDNPAFLEGLQTYLHNDHCECYDVMASFTSGIELLSYINFYDPDIILLDIQMPGMSGIEAATKLNYYDNRLKLVALISECDTTNVQQLIKAGFRGMVDKSDLDRQLGTVIEKVMKGELLFPVTQ
jgi:DNA-binding NarL/FixJ family response regulator